MPRFRQHLAINVAVVSIFEFVQQRQEISCGQSLEFDWARYAAHVAAGSVVGALPDLLEPSLGNPNHRGFCHSVAAAVMVWWLVSGKHTRELEADLRRFLAVLGVAYSSHLAADLFLSKAKGMGFVCAKF